MRTRDQLPDISQSLEIESEDIEQGEPQSDRKPSRFALEPAAPPPPRRPPPPASARGDATTPGTSSAPPPGKCSRPSSGSRTRACRSTSRSGCWASFARLHRGLFLVPAAPAPGAGEHQPAALGRAAGRCRDAGGALRRRAPRRPPRLRRRRSPACPRRRRARRPLRRPARPRRRRARRPRRPNLRAPPGPPRRRPAQARRAGGLRSPNWCGARGRFQ